MLSNNLVSEVGIGFFFGGGGGGKEADLGRTTSRALQWGSSGACDPFLISLFSS